MSATKKNSKGKWTKIIIAFTVILLISGALLAYEFYQRFTAPNTQVPEDEQEGYLYIPTGSDFNALISIVEKSKLIKSTETFRWVAIQMKLNQHIHPGRYKVEKDMTNLQLVRLLHSGKQTPVKLVLKKFRTKEQLAAFVGSKLELDSSVLARALNDDIYLQKFDVNPDNSMVLFLPNTHEFYWTITLDKFMERIKSYFDEFWTETRKDKAKLIGLTPIEVSILASIVEEETNSNEEKPLIASVYLNRLKKDMPLQADPTVKYALHRFDLRRILSIHTKTKSPFNTYQNKGLPPGPICTPSEASINAVLNSVDTKFLYFCANPEKPGTHIFAVNYGEHLRNAARYQKSLNQRNITE